MLPFRTLFSTLLVSTSLLTHAATDTSYSKEAMRENAVKKASGVNYTIHIDNKKNKNNAVDSVLVILDKFDRTGAGIVTKVFYPGAGNQICLQDVPAGRYYADVYVLGAYKKHFSQVIRANKQSRKNKLRLQIDYKDMYVPGAVSIPAENLALFVYNR